jgi:hypothetical protein
MTVRAVKTIEKDEEILVSYFNGKVRYSTEGKVRELHWFNLDPNPAFTMKLRSGSGILG